MSKKKTIQLVKGMKDILPEDQKYWRYLHSLVESLAQQYSFKMIQTPILEPTELFNRALGNTGDVVEKEMYSFKDAGDENLTLRPEGTAGVARAYLEHGMINQPQPVKLYYFGPFFRRDRPQAGRYRQFHQAGFEVIGEQDPVVDAQVILIAYKLYTKLQLPVVVEINSIGCAECRPEYEKLLKDYFRKVKNKLSELSQARLAKNPLRILDSKEAEDQEIIKGAPQQIDSLCESCKKHFILVLEYLDELEVPYNLNHTIVRGLDYYNRTAFEFFLVSEDERSQSALGGGGRYDGLITQLGGQATPAVGFAVGLERFINVIRERDLKVPDYPGIDVFLAQLGVDARKKALKLFENLYANDVRVAEGFAKSGLKSQLEMANKMNAKYTLIIGQKELVDGTVMIRDMEGGIQEVVDYARAVEEIKKRLEKAKQYESQIRVVKEQLEIK